METEAPRGAETHSELTSGLPEAGKRKEIYPYRPTTPPPLELPEGTQLCQHHTLNALNPLTPTGLQI